MTTATRRCRFMRRQAAWRRVALLLLLQMCSGGAADVAFGTNTSSTLLASSTLAGVDPAWQGLSDVVANHRDEVMKLQLRIAQLSAQVHGLQSDLDVANKVIRDRELRVSEPGSHTPLHNVAACRSSPHTRCRVCNVLRVE